MVRTPSILLKAFTLTVALLGLTACVDAPKAGDTSNTSIYVYDSGALSIKAWSDVATLFAATTVPAQNREITGGAISNSSNVLGWGGLAMDTRNNRIYLVFENGLVARVEHARTQNGDLTNSSDLTTFTLGSSSDRFSGGSTFGSAVLDSAGTLYATETSTNGGTDTRIWAVANAGSIGSGSTVAANGSFIQSLATGDSGATGVAVGSNNVVYAFFANGNSVTVSFSQTLNGARIRASSGGVFPYSTSLVIGDATTLGTSATYGSLAFDSSTTALYATRTTSDTTQPAVVVFTPGQFNAGSPNAAPNRTLGDTVASLPNLRFIVHAGTKDWLAGASRVASGTGTGVGTNSLFLWKAPSAGGTAVQFLLGSSVAIRGLALDGNS